MTSTPEALGALGSALGIQALPIPAGESVANTYLLVATGTDRGLLVPADSRRAAAASVLRLSNGQSALSKFGRGMFWGGTRMGALRWLTGKRFRLVGPDGSRPVLLDHIAEVLGPPSLRFAFSLGPPRPNRKPVVQILEPTGQTVGFAKIGWNDLTTRLVSHEAEYLQAMPREAGSRIRAPEIVHHGRWHGLTLTILSALKPGIQATFRSPVPDTRVLLEIASLGGRRRQQGLGVSDLANSLLSRAQNIDHHSRAVAVEAAQGLIGRHEDVQVELGDWHGDFGPWNVAPAGQGRFNVWDWERASGPQVVGMDLYHYHFQRENLRGSTIETCIERSNQRTAAAITEIQGGDFPQELTGRLYLLERLLRYREPGAPQEASSLEAAITSRLRSSG